MYTSLDAKKLANLLDEEDEEEMLAKMMSAKMAGRSISRVTNTKSGKGESSSMGLLKGEEQKTTDLDFHIDQVCMLQIVSVLHY